EISPFESFSGYRLYHSHQPQWFVCLLVVKLPATGLLSDHRPDLFSSAPSCSAFDVTVVQALDFAMMPELVHRRVRQQNQPILTSLLLHVLLLPYVQDTIVYS